MAAHRNLLLPVENPTETFWHNHLHPLHNYKSTEDLPQTCDVLIIGAGFAGVAAAYSLVKGEGRSWPQNISVVILEARGVCSGATGRNGGHIRPELFGRIPTYIERYGVEAAEEFAKYEIENLHALTGLINEESINCDLVVTRTCNVFTNQEDADKHILEYESLAKLGYMNDVELTTGKEAEHTSGVRNAKACSTYPAATVFPYKFVSHLLASAMDTGRVNLQTHTPVTGIAKEASGELVVKTARGFIKTAKVIHANNGYVGGLLPEYAYSIIPCKGICSHISMPEGSTVTLAAKSYIIRTPDKGVDYFISRPDGSIIVGGASHKFGPFKDQWFNNIDDSNLIESAKDYYNGYVQRTFRGWENSNSSVDQIWTGVMGYSYDSLPHVGEVPDRPDQIILAGFNGHGMPVIWLAAKGVAEMILKDKKFEEIGLPKIMKTTTDRIMNAKHGPVGGDVFIV